MTTELHIPKIQVRSEHILQHCWWNRNLGNRVLITCWWSSFKCQENFIRESCTLEQGLTFEEINKDIRTYRLIGHLHKGWDEELCKWTMDDSWRIWSSFGRDHFHPKTRDGKTEVYKWLESHLDKEEMLTLYGRNWSCIVWIDDQ